MRHFETPPDPKPDDGGDDKPEGGDAGGEGTESGGGAAGE